jgi:hypothetical protein
MSPCSFSQFLYLCSGRLAKQLELSLIFLDSNYLHLNQSKGVRWVWQSSRFACPITLLACFYEVAVFHEQKGSDSMESSTSSMFRGRFISMNSSLFINADGTIVHTSATSRAEQRWYHLWLPRAWPLPHPPLAMAATWKEAECGTEAACIIRPCHRARCLRGSPRAWVRSEHLLARGALVLCLLLHDRRAHVALIVIFGVES